VAAQRTVTAALSALCPRAGTAQTGQADLAGGLGRFCGGRGPHGGVALFILLLISEIIYGIKIPEDSINLQNT
jgi:hypothetical protein